MFRWSKLHSIDLYKMFNSAEYWEKRYKTGGNSGCGSYNALAMFKAEVINTCIKDFAIRSIIDYGVGDGNQLQLLNTEGLQYYGLDVSTTIIDRCKALFPTKSFSLVSEFEGQNADLTVSCDVLYHLIEDSVYYEYLNRLFNTSNKYVIVYARNENRNHAPHVKFRYFTDYIATAFPQFSLMQHIPNKYPQIIIGQNNDSTSPSDFYIYCKVLETV